MDSTDFYFQTIYILIFLYIMRQFSEKQFSTSYPLICKIILEKALFRHYDFIYIYIYL